MNNPTMAEGLFMCFAQLRADSIGPLDGVTHSALECLIMFAQNMCLCVTSDYAPEEPCSEKGNLS